MPCVILQLSANTWVGQEIMLDPEIIYVQAYGDLEFPSISFDGTNYFIVWQDDGRHGPNDPNIYGARITPEGVVLDSSSIAISTAQDYQKYPSVCFGESNYLVVWEDERNNSPNEYICGSRVTLGGIVLDTNGIKISNSASSITHPSVSFDGTNYFVVWDDGDYNTNNVYGARVNQSGIVLDSTPIDISIANDRQCQPSVCFGENYYFAVWSDWRHGGADFEIYGTRVTTNGEVLEPDGILICEEDYRRNDPSVCFDGENYFVVWKDERNSSQIYGSFVDTNGVVLDTNGCLIPMNSDYQSAPTVSFDGRNYLVAAVNKWIYGPGWEIDIFGTRVSTSGNILDPFSIRICQTSGEQKYPALSFDGTNYFAVWQDHRPGSHSDYDSKIYGARIDTAGSVIDTANIVVSYSANTQYYPSVDFNGSKYFVVWSDNRNDTWDIYGVRVDSFGNILEPLAIPISIDVGDQYTPSVCSSNINYFVVWTHNYEGSYGIYGARVGFDGNVIDTLGIQIWTSQKSQLMPTVCFDGKNFLAIWCSDQDYFDFDIYGARISTNGALIDSTPILVSVEQNTQYSPNIIFNGENSFVVWVDARNDTMFREGDIYGARIDTQGTVLDPLGIPISSSINDQRYPMISFDGTNHLVIWEEGYRIQGIRTTTEGIVIDSVGNITPGTEHVLYHTITFDDSNYILVWQNWQYTEYQYNFIYEADLYATRISPEGVVLDPNGIPIADSRFAQWYPGIAYGNSNRSLIAYISFNDTPYGSSRICGRIFGKEIVRVRDNIESNSRIKISRILNIYPNPFLQTTIIRYQIANKGKVSLKIYDLSGRLIKTIINEEMSTGFYNVNLEMKGLISGIYFVRLESGDFVSVKKAIILR